MFFGYIKYEPLNFTVKFIKPTQSNILTKHNNLLSSPVWAYYLMTFCQYRKCQLNMVASSVFS